MYVAVPVCRLAQLAHVAKYIIRYFLLALTRSLIALSCSPTAVQENVRPATVHDHRFPYQPPRDESGLSLTAFLRHREQGPQPSAP